MNIKETAGILKVGFLLKYFSKKQIVDWADKKILEGCEDSSIIDMAFVESRADGELLSLLGAIIEESGAESKDFLDQYFLGLYKVKLGTGADKNEWINIEKEMLKYFSIVTSDLSDEKKLFLSILNNDFSLREGGYAGVMAMPGSLISYLESYGKFYELQEQLGKEGIGPPVLNSVQIER